MRWLVLIGLCACQDTAVPTSTRTAVAGGDAEAGLAVIERVGCVACHDIPGAQGPSSHLAVSLAHFARKSFIAGVWPNDPPTLMRWLRDPPALLPGTAMPVLGLGDKETRDVATYLYTLD